MTSFIKLLSKLSLIILLLSDLTSHASSSAPLCFLKSQHVQGNGIGSAHQGEELFRGSSLIFEYLDPQAMVSGMRVWKLSNVREVREGEGVFRVLIEEPKSSDPFSPGVYKVSLPRNMAEAEVNKLSEIKGWIEAFEVENVETRFKVAVARIAPVRDSAGIFNHYQKSIYLSDVLGRPLDQVLSDPKVKNEVKDSLLALYQERKSHYIRALTANGLSKDQWSRTVKDFALTDQVEALTISLRKSGYGDKELFHSEEGFYMLFPAQVIVNPVTFDMTIVDSF